MRLIRFPAFLLTAFVVLSAAAPAAFAADIRQAGRTGIVIEGEIAQGDHARLTELLDRNRGAIDTVSVYSNGGNVFEAIKMGALIRDLRLRTVAPRRYGPGGNLCTGIANARHCTCVSACVFVYAGGIHRSGNVLGVHRSYVTGNYPAYERGMNGADASQQLAHTASAHLKTMGFPQSIIDRMNATHSRNISYLRDTEISQSLSGHVRPFGDRIAAQCRRQAGGTGIDRTTDMLCRQNAEQRLRKEVFERVIREAKQNAAHPLGQTRQRPSSPSANGSPPGAAQPPISPATVQQTRL